MPLRTRSAVPSRTGVLRVLAVMLAVVAVAGAALIGWWGPHLARAQARETASGTLSAATVALLGKCELVGAEGTAMAREVASYAKEYGSVTPLGADAATLRAAGRQPTFAFAVLDLSGTTVAVAGAPAGRAAVQAGGENASCSEGQAGGGGRGGAGLGERFEVRVPGRAVGSVVVRAPLDADALRAYERDGTTLTLLGRDGVVLAGREPASAVHNHVGKGNDEGTAAGVAFAVTRSSRGLPYTLVATSPVRGAALLEILALGVLAIGLVVPVVTYRLAGEQSRRFDDEIAETGSELERSRRTLQHTLAHFGAALENTHDLEALLDTVVSACVDASGAVAGLAMLIETDEHGRGQGRRTLLPLGAAHTDTAPANQVAAELPTLAEHYLTWTAVTNERTPLMSHRQPAGPALAVAMTHGEKLVGVLVVAKGPGAKAFDALAPIRVAQIAEHAGTAVENVRAHEEARRLSVTDPLTGVGNVRQLSTTLSREVAGALRFDRKLTVLMLDLDHFKQVNDTLGHQFGDVVLREFAHRVLGCVREMDTVARYGGEEFAVVLPETDVEGGRRVAERVLSEIRARPIRHGDVEYAITVSIGVAGFPQHGRSVAEVLRSADAALYTAKKEGRDRWALAERPAGAPRVSQAG